MPVSRSFLLRLLPPLVLAAAGAVLHILLLPLELRSVENQITGFPDSDVSAHLARPMILAMLCYLPALGALVYAFGNTLDRYVTRLFLGIFGVCLGALLTIWLLIDLNDNLSDLRGSGNMLKTAAIFYGTRVPAILLLLLPYGLLLSLLYCLGKLSKDREIVAMIQSGRSITRVVTPLIAAGVFSSLLCLGLNYHWAPIAEGRRSEILDAARGRAVTQATDVLYRNAEKRRLWMVGAFPKDYEHGAPLLNVEVTSTRKDGSLQSRLSADRAIWNREERTWTFEKPVIGRFTPGQPPEFEIPEEPIVRRTWAETPWQLIKPGLAASYLGIPDLNGWLIANEGNELTAKPAPYQTQWHYRWALPFTCLVTVFLAAPLSIHFSRRGSGGGVFLAVVLSALLMLVSSITLSLGEAGIIRPILGAWLPNLLFSLLGLYLFHRRITGRPIYQTLLKLLPGGGT